MVTATRVTTQILGKVRNDRVAKTAPAGRPKSDCATSKPDEYGASMAALGHSVFAIAVAWKAVTMNLACTVKTVTSVN